MTAPDEREFILFQRGHVRDRILLAHFRNRIRSMTNPDTGQPFTEDEIARATQDGTRFFIEADAIDLYGQSQQARAAFWADQVDPRRAASGMLYDLHGRLWLGENSQLPAVGAGGTVRWPATVGSLFVGDSTLGSLSAFVATDANGRRYQCLTTVTANSSGYADLTMRAVDGGVLTNLDPATSLRASANPPGGAQANGTVQAQIGNSAVGLSGGFDAETDGEYSERIEERYRYRPASGNGAHFVAWARQATVAVESTFVYACALHAGSTLVAVLQKRNKPAISGPNARIPAASVLADVTGYLVPPNSPVVPERVYVQVLLTVPEAVDMVMQLTMPAGLGGGWLDAEPWPSPAAPSNPALIDRALVGAVTDQTHFVLNLPTGVGSLPGGVSVLSGNNAPSLMQWVAAKSRFERLQVQSVTDSGSGNFAVVLSGPPTNTIATGVAISPYTDRHDVAANALEDYFDQLGAGELVSASDARYARAARYPAPNQAKPQRVGLVAVSAVVDALGGAASDGELPYLSQTLPSVPTDPMDGPSLLVLGRVNMYAL